MVFKVSLYFELKSEDGKVKFPDLELVRERVQTQVRDLVPDRIRITGTWLGSDRIFAYHRTPEEALENFREHINKKPK